jgi:hypothetical protein
MKLDDVPSAGRAADNNSGQKIPTGSPYFMVAFLTITVLTVSTTLLGVILANMWSTPTPNQQTMFETILWISKVEFLTLLTLLIRSIVFGEGLGRKLVELVRIASSL